MVEVNESYRNSAICVLQCNVMGITTPAPWSGLWHLMRDLCHLLDKNMVI